MIVLWIEASAALVTAVCAVAQTFAHGRQDRRRFADHGQRIKDLENGGPPVLRETTLNLRGHRHDDGGAQVIGQGGQMVAGKLVSDPG